MSAWKKRELEELLERIETGANEDVERLVSAHGGAFPTNADVKKEWLGVYDTAEDALYSKTMFGFNEDVFDSLMQAGIAPTKLPLVVFREPYLFEPKAQEVLRSGARDIRLYTPSDEAKKNKATARSMTVRLLDQKVRNEPKNIPCRNAFYLFINYPEDFEFYEMLQKAGLKVQRFTLPTFNTKLFWFLTFNGYWKTLEYIVRNKKGFRASEIDINSNWTPQDVDRVRELGLRVSGFYRGSSADTILHALKIGCKLSSDESSFWGLVMSYDNVELARRLLNDGREPKNLNGFISPSDPETLTALDEMGILPKFISTDSTKQVLIRAAELGMVPVSPVVYKKDMPEWLISKGAVEISQSLDKDVIEAFLSSGLEGLDPSYALDANRDDIVSLFESYGKSSSRKTITDGTPYVKDAKIIVPEGIVEIEKEAFLNANAVEIHLPESLERIGERAFCNVGVLFNTQHPTSVEVPKSVRKIGYGAFFGIPSITIYDSIDPDIELKIDRLNGITPSSIGWSGIRVNELYANYPGPPNALVSNFEVCVKSAETGVVKYRVWMPLEALRVEERCVYTSAWGPNATFAFKDVDPLFDSIGKAEDRFRTAVARLRWPMDLDDELKEKFRHIVSKHPTKALRLLIDWDDLEGIGEIGEDLLIRKKDIESLIVYAKADSRSPRIARYLREFSERESKKGSSQGIADKKTRKLKWNKQRAQDFLELTQSGDISHMSTYLESIEGGSIPPKGVLSKKPLEFWEQNYWDLLLQACISQLDPELFDYLSSKGLDVANLANEGCNEEQSRNAALIPFYYLKKALAANPSKMEDGKRLTLDLIDKGMRIDPAPMKVGRLYIEILSIFDEDEAFFDKLKNAGLSMVSDRAWGGDEETIENALYHNDTRIVAYLMNRGAKLSRLTRYGRKVWDRWSENPQELAALVKEVPANSIEPASYIPPIVVRAMDLEALEVLEGWAGAYNSFTIGDIVDSARAMGFEKGVEALEVIEARLHKELSEESVSPEMFEAVRHGAVTPDGRLINVSRLVKDNRVVIPEGVVLIEDNAFEGTGFLDEVVFPDTLCQYPDHFSGLTPNITSFPSTMVDNFEELFIGRYGYCVVIRGLMLPERLAVRLKEAYSYGQTKKPGDTQATVEYLMGMLSRAKDSGEDKIKDRFSRYQDAIDRAIADGTIKASVNVSRVTVARLIDQTSLLDEYREMYIAKVKSNRARWEKLFADEQDTFFAELLPLAYEIAMDGNLTS